MPDSAPAPRRLHLKGLFAAALVAALISQRALLDPLTRAVTLQRSLLGHGDVASRLLAGRTALEDERRLRQHTVDADLVGLQATLAAGLWTRALGEAHALAQGWRSLSWQVAQGAIGQPACQEAHLVLVEQVVQVMDLVTATAQPADAAWARLALRGRDGPAEAALHARLEAVQARLAAAHEARAASAAAAAACAVALLAALARLLRRSRPGTPPAAGDVRRNHGRRSTDAQGPDSQLPWSRSRSFEAGPQTGTAATGPDRSAGDT
jgi:hypothetical protein